MKHGVSQIFVSGIGTGVGKTVVSALLVKVYGAHYWKPIQCGDLEQSDTQVVRDLVGPTESQKFFPEAYRFESACSPTRAALLERGDVNWIDLDHLRPPRIAEGEKLVIEGAGGLMVPLNQKVTFLDFLQRSQIPLVLVSQNYLGSLNHTLLSLEAIKARGLKDWQWVINGDEDLENEALLRQLMGKKPLFTLRPMVELKVETLELKAKQLRSELC